MSKLLVSEVDPDVAIDFNEYSPNFGWILLALSPLRKLTVQDLYKLQMQHTPFWSQIQILIAREELSNVRSL